MLYASRADLRQAFCSYCGYPPMGRWRTHAHRVCTRCQRGMVLRAAPGLQPRFDEPFVIVDEGLHVQTVSRHAEVVLMVDEPAAVDAPLSDFLISNNGDRDQSQLSRLVRNAVAGSTLASTVELRTVGDPRIRFVVRIAACGPPASALLMLASVAADQSRSARRNGNRQR